MLGFFHVLRFVLKLLHVEKYTEFYQKIIGFNT